MAELIIEAGRSEGQYWRDLWRYRELFYVLAWRDIAVRYKQTAVGVAWALIQPLINTVLLVFIFQYIAQMKSTGDVPYPLLVFAASMPWQFFSAALGGTSQSVLSSAGLISKVYFPRLIVPSSAVVTALADLGVAFILLAGMMVWFHFLPNWHIVFLPLFIALAFCAALGPGLLLTALTVKYRDFRFITPFIIQVGTLASPVGYSSVVPAERLPKLTAHLHLPVDPMAIYSLNPMVSVIEGFRWCLLGHPLALSTPNFVLSAAMTFFLLFLGVWYFRKTEKSFADVI